MIITSANFEIVVSDGSNSLDKGRALDHLDHLRLPKKNQVQVTLDNSNFDFSKFAISLSQIPVPILFPYITKQIYSRSLDLSISRSSRSLQVIFGPVK
jgi:hypothetical protein